MTKLAPHCCPSSEHGQLVAHTVSFLKIMADLNRMRVVCFLQKGTQNVNAITRSLDLPQNLVSHHLRVLREADILRTERRGQEILYSVNPAHLSQHLEILKTVLSSPKRQSSSKGRKNRTKA